MIFDFEHLSKNNFTYFQHLQRAVTIGVYMMPATVAVLIHAIFPFIFPTAASKIISKLIEKTPNFPLEELEKDK